MSPPTARIIPTVYKRRIRVSLYHAQDTTHGLTISPRDVRKLVDGLKAFSRTCDEYGVPLHQREAVGTEALRRAENSAAVCAKVEEQSGWKIQILSPEQEARLGANGVVSSLDRVDGLVMDLGGGSLQLSCVTPSAVGDGVSLPLGAETLTQMICEAGKDGQEALHNRVVEQLKDALATLGIDRASKVKRLYMTGGSLRAWALAFLEYYWAFPWPIPFTNGLRLKGYQFREAEPEDDALSFCKSPRRARQRPAVVFLIKCFQEAIEDNEAIKGSKKTKGRIQYVYFCQGGVREGRFFNGLPPDVRTEHPLIVATQGHAPANAPELMRELQTAVSGYRLPQVEDSEDRPTSRFYTAVLTALVNSMYVHAQLPKDVAAVAALHSTTAGFLAGAHGLSHEERAALAVALCERYRGGYHMEEADRDFRHSLHHVLNSWRQGLVTWSVMLGRIAAVLGHMYPSGREKGEPRVTVKIYRIPPPEPGVAAETDSEPAPGPGVAAEADGVPAPEPGIMAGTVCVPVPDPSVTAETDGGPLLDPGVAVETDCVPSPDCGLTVVEFEFYDDEVGTDDVLHKAVAAVRDVHRQSHSSIRLAVDFKLKGTFYDAADAEVTRGPGEYVMVERTGHGSGPS